MRKNEIEIKQQMLKIIPQLKKLGNTENQLISRKDQFLENTDKYIAVLYISSNTGRNIISKFTNQAGM